jgi:hypothetical protein
MIVAWFMLLVPSLEQMPDEDVYQIGAPDRATVHVWYEADCVRFDTVFERCSVAYFRKIWRAYLPKIKLRRYNRFTKCSV